MKQPSYLAKLLFLPLISIALFPSASLACDKKCDDTGMPSTNHNGSHLQVYVKVKGNDDSKDNVLYTLTAFDKNHGASHNQDHTPTELKAGVEYTLTNFTLDDGSEHGPNETVTYSSIPILVKLTDETYSSEFTLSLQKEQDGSGGGHMHNNSYVVDDPGNIVCMDACPGENGLSGTSGTNAETWVVISAESVPYGLPAGHIKIIYPTSTEYATADQSKFIREIIDLLSPKYTRYFDTSQKQAIIESYDEENKQGSIEAVVVCSSFACTDEVY